MSRLVFSSGLVLQSDEIESAELYPEQWLDNYGFSFGLPEVTACPYLFIRTVETTERVAGLQALADAAMLEAVGIHVRRHPAVTPGREGHRKSTGHGGESQKKF